MRCPGCWDLMRGGVRWMGDVYSFSSLEASLCLRRYLYKYVERLPEAPSPAMELGRAAHKVIQLAVTRQAYKDLAELCREACSSEEQASEVLGMVSRLFRDWRPAGKLGKTLHVELRFDLPLDGEAGPRLVGYIDLLELSSRGAVVTDFKSGWKPLDLLGSRQLGIYAWAVKEEMGVPGMVLVRYHYLRDGRREEALFGPEQIGETVGWAKERVDAVRAAAEAGSYPASPGRRCLFCDWPDRCFLGRPLSLDPGELAGVVLVLEPVLAEARERLKAVVARGPLAVDGEWFGYYPRTEYAATDLRGFFAALKGLGEDPAGYVAPVSKRLWGLLQGGGPVADAVVPYVRKVERPWFRRGKEPPPGSGVREFPVVPVDLPPLPEEPLALAGWVLMAEAVLNRAKAGLREDVEANGPVRVGDAWFGIWPWVSWEVPDMRAFFRALSSVGLDPARYVDVDGRKLWREFRDATPLAEAVEPYLIRRERKEFEHRSSAPVAP